MIITSVKMKELEGTGRLKGAASITFDDCFVIHGIKIIERMDGTLFIAMPSIKKDDGTFADIAHPINSNMRDIISKAVLDAYNNIDDANIGG